jgi:hypothetical protein
LEQFSPTSTLRKSNRGHISLIPSNSAIEATQIEIDENEDIVSRLENENTVLQKENEALKVVVG